MDHAREIVLVRHGETPYNTAARVGRFFASQSEVQKAGCVADHQVPLTPLGREQALGIGAIIHDLGSYDVAFHSPYRRTTETLECILESFPAETRSALPCKPHLDLRERDQGYIVNMDVTQIVTYFPWYPEYEGRAGKFYARPPGGESIADVCGRVHDFLSSLRRARAGERILVVTHGRVILAFQYWLEKQAPQQVEEAFLNRSELVPNCGIVRYVYDHAAHRYTTAPLPSPAV